MKTLIKKTISRIASSVLVMVPLCFTPPFKKLRTLRQTGKRVRVLNDSGLPFYSQYGQDRYIWEAVLKRSPRGGYFIDIGAYDGLTFSNTKFYEESLGWQGLLIEPNPVLFHRLKDGRKNECLPVGIAPCEGTLEFIQCDGYGEMLSCFADFASDEHLHRIDCERIAKGFGVRRVDVEVKTIENVLESRNIIRVDYLSVDVEGLEIELLKAFPFDRVSVGVISVEANGDMVALEVFLYQKGFRLAAIVGTDHIYTATGKRR